MKGFVSSSLVGAKVHCYLIVKVVKSLPLIAVTGMLKGYDQLLNLVLDEVTEELQGRSAIVHDE